jgi:hypothetical protein
MTMFIDFIYNLNPFILEVLLWAIMLSFTVLSVKIIRYFIPVHKDDSDAFGAFVNVSGPIYAILMGFIIFTGISNFEKAEAQADNEVELIYTINVEASALPAPIPAQSNALLKEYLNKVIHEEWPAMRAGKSISNAAEASILQLLTLIQNYQPIAEWQANIWTNIFENINKLLLAHRTRINYVENLSLGTDIWITVILINIAILICNSFYFVNRKEMRAFITLISFMVSVLVFLTIRVDKPYMGSYSISSILFQEALTSLESPPQKTL